VLALLSCSSPCRVQGVALSCLRPPTPTAVCCWVPGTFRPSRGPLTEAAAGYTRRDHPLASVPPNPPGASPAAATPLQERFMSVSLASPAYPLPLALPRLQTMLTSGHPESFAPPPTPQTLACTQQYNPSREITPLIPTNSLTCPPLLPTPRPNHSAASASPPRVCSIAAQRCATQPPHTTYASSAAQVPVVPECMPCFRSRDGVLAPPGRHHSPVLLARQDTTTSTLSLKATFFRDSMSVTSPNRTSAPSNSCTPGRAVCGRPWVVPRLLVRCASGAAAPARLRGACSLLMHPCSM
jgi:hypothetical protein